MEKIASFTIDHEKLLRGIYVSRQDSIEDKVVTTFDIRMKEPNREPVMDMPVMHTIEHLGATYLRNDKEWDEKTVYFGPMGCRTGFYVIFKNDLTSKEVFPIIKNMFEFISNYEGEIPGAAPKDCGNYLEQNLAMSKYEASKYLTEVLSDIKEENLIYPK